MTSATVDGARRAGCADGSCAEVSAMICSVSGDLDESPEIRSCSTVQPHNPAAGRRAAFRHDQIGILTAVQPMRVLLFDVFGTLVDWRSSLIDIAEAAAGPGGPAADWAGVVDDWRRLAGPRFPPARNPARRARAARHRAVRHRHRNAGQRLAAAAGLAGQPG